MIGHLPKLKRNHNVIMYLFLLKFKTPLDTLLSKKRMIAKAESLLYFHNITNYIINK